MPFSNEEQQIIIYGKQQGKNRDEILRALNNYKLGIKTSPVQPQEQGFGSRLSGAFQGGIEQAKQGIQTATTSTNPLEVGAGLTKTAAGVIGAATSPITAAVQPIIEPTLGAAVQKTADVISDIPAVQKFAGTQAGQRTEQIADFAQDASVVAGTILGFKPTTQFAKSALAKAEDVLKNSRSANLVVKPSAVVPKGGVIKDIRFNLSEIDPQVETILKRTTTDEVNRYFQQAQNALKDPAKATPLELAGSKAESAFDVIDTARASAVRGKKSILGAQADKRIAGNAINDVYKSAVAAFDERFGARLDSKGAITQQKGRTLVLDNADLKLASEYFSRLNRLGVAPTLRQVDDFVDWAQSQLYKQSKSLSKLETASDPVVSQLRQVTGDLNTRLKSSVGNGYAETNARIQQLIELQDELSAALGADARKGGGLMKRLFSPAGGNTRSIFEQIRQETGIDLVKEATLAKFAMENVGDTRQSSLLKSLDVAIKESQQLDLTRPATIVNWLRENADLDGQQLANEFIRRNAR